MVTIKETLQKINSLDDNNITLVINLVDYLSDMQSNRTQEENPFRSIRASGKEHWLSEDEIDELVAEIKEEHYAARY